MSREDTKSFRSAMERSTNLKPGKTSEDSLIAINIVFVLHIPLSTREIA